MILRLRKKKETDMLNTRNQPPPRALWFSLGRGERETRESGDEPQGTMGLLLRAHFHRKRDVWVRGRRDTLCCAMWPSYWLVDTFSYDT